MAHARLPSLTPQHQVEVTVTITHPIEGEIARGILSLDNDEGRAIQFSSAALAVQAGVYQVLKQIWPQEG